jgi:hypothetical protein
MLSPKVTVSITTGTEEHHFTALDRHQCDTYETLHDLRLSSTLISLSIIGIEVTILMIQAIKHNATVLYTCLLLLNCVEFLNFDMPHQRFCGYQNPFSCHSSQLHRQATRSKPGDHLTKGLSDCHNPERIPCHPPIIYGRAAKLHSTTGGDNEL